MLYGEIMSVDDEDHSKHKKTTIGTKFREFRGVRIIVKSDF